MLGNLKSTGSGGYNLKLITLSLKLKTFFSGNYQLSFNLNSFCHPRN